MLFTNLQNLFYYSGSKIVNISDKIFAEAAISFKIKMSEHQNYLLNKIEPGYLRLDKKMYKLKLYPFLLEDGSFRYF